MAETGFVIADDARKPASTSGAEVISISDRRYPFFRLDGYMELRHFRRRPDRAVASPATRRCQPLVSN